ncbi:unnamed protein product [Tilletia laevis]|uniref:F-box domain-containing protein n=2 Tax=Tilletia TaxID=13289 RepID=A0A177UPS8_9BASI|nr:hypothetical protein CF336_g3626 [Tilletia laevis]KAE8241792.1 hypothetical protein A4X03_0g8084 [Tilletia caries]KAE8203804.1 hypothetical protein CF335_g2890 [Tilletia laevis]CAD6930711.1 unnamed protein product [Tilletia laevis]CAD6941751.1 unnamed protein product [Tilletia laevis]
MASLARRAAAATPDRATTKSKGKGKARAREGAVVAAEGDGGRGGDPVFVPQLPYEILLMILGFAARAADDSARPLAFLLLNKRVSQDLWPHIYRRVTLSTYASLDSFSSLLLNQPHLRKLVKALWIGPRSLHSDLLRALAPDDVQLHHERSAWSLVLRRTHNILRSCRNIQNLALSGKLISVDHAESYGKACAPREVWGINPYSFVCAYTADILDKTEIFQLYDLTLAQEECSSIVQMRQLRHFIWTTPALSSTSTFSSSAAGVGNRYHPPREAALLWRLLLLSNPNTYNRKTRPPLKATFIAGSDLVADIESFLCPVPLPTVKAKNTKTTNWAHHGGNQSPHRKRGAFAAEHPKHRNHSRNGDSISTRASIGGHSSSDGETQLFNTGAGSDLSDSEEGDDDYFEEINDDEGDSDSDRPPYASSSSQYHHHHNHSNDYLHPSASSHSSAIARAEALEASLRSLSFNDVPPALFLYQPSPSVSSGHSHGHSNGHGHGNHSQYHGQGRFDGSVDEEPTNGGVLQQQGGGSGSGSDSVDPDAALNALSYDPPSLHTHHHNNTNQHHHHQSRRLTARAPSLSSLTSTRASTHGHSFHNHAHTPVLQQQQQQQQQQQRRPTLDDIDAPNRLRTQVVPRQMVLEWEALRDRVCPVNPPISPLAALTNPYIGYGALGGVGASTGAGVGLGLGGSGGEGDGQVEEEEIDPGHALWRIWQMWLEATEI